MSGLDADARDAALRYVAWKHRAELARVMRGKRRLGLDDPDLAPLNEAAWVAYDSFAGRGVGPDGRTKPAHPMASLARPPALALYAPDVAYDWTESVRGERVRVRVQSIHIGNQPTARVVLTIQTLDGEPLVRGESISGPREISNVEFWQHQRSARLLQPGLWGDVWSGQVRRDAEPIGRMRAELHQVVAPLSETRATLLAAWCRLVRGYDVRDPWETQPDRSVDLTSMLLEGEADGAVRVADRQMRTVRVTCKGQKTSRRGRDA